MSSLSKLRDTSNHQVTSKGAEPTGEEEVLEATRAPRRAQKLRPNYPRTRTGCLTCRARKKKCDETKPRCQGCHRNALPCKWPADDKDDTISNQQVSVWQVECPSKEKTICPASENSMLISRKDAPWSGEGAASATNMLSAALGIFSGDLRPCTLTPVSFQLLSHYVGVTGAMLAMVPAERNPFITHLIPMAYVDDLLMHSLLALSGRHLAFKSHENTTLEIAHLKHYSATIRGVRDVIQDPNNMNGPKMLHLLMVLIALCHCEGIEGDKERHIFQHLHASRELIVRLLQRDDLSAAEKNYFGLSMELYAYVVLVNSVAPCYTADIRNLPFDPFVMDLSSLSGYPTFGAMFGGCHGLFEIIPYINLLATRRLGEEKLGISSPSLESKAMYEKLKHRIQGWTLEKVVRDEDPSHWEERRLSAEVLRQGVHIYLETAAMGSQTTDRELRKLIQEHIDEMMSGDTALLETSPYSAILLWPLIMASSCMVQEIQRGYALAIFRDNRFHMKNAVLASDLLEFLWADNDHQSFGPYGLLMMRQKHGLYLQIT